MSDLDVVECSACWAKPGAPTLCERCLHNRKVAGLFRLALRDMERQRDQALSLRNAEVADLKARLKAARKVAEWAEPGDHGVGYCDVPGCVLCAGHRATDLRRNWRRP